MRAGIPSLAFRCARRSGRGAPSKPNHQFCCEGGAFGARPTLLDIPLVHVLSPAAYAEPRGARPSLGRRARRGLFGMNHAAEPAWL